MEWVIGIATGLIVAVVISGGNWLRRRYWNPVEWVFARSDGDTWDFKYVGRREVYDVDIRAAYLGPESPQPEIERGLTWPFNADMSPGARLLVRFLAPLPNSPYSLTWIDRRGRRQAQFKVTRARDILEIRRKDSTDLSQPHGRVVGE